MADTLPNVQLPADTWVDLYAATGIAVGTQIIIENLGSSEVQIVTSAAQPSDTPAGYQRIGQRKQKINSAGDSGAWARVFKTIGLLNIQEA